MKLTFPMALMLLFIGLKLTNYIDWSWWWVLSPMWIGLCIGVVVFVGAAIYYIWLETPEAKTQRMLREMAKKLAR